MKQKIWSIAIVAMIVVHLRIQNARCDELPYERPVRHSIQIELAGRGILYSLQYQIQFYQFVGLGAGAMLFLNPGKIGDSSPNVSDYWTVFPVFLSFAYPIWEQKLSVIFEPGISFDSRHSESFALGAGLQYIANNGFLIKLQGYAFGQEEGGRGTAHYDWWPPTGGLTLGKAF